MGLATPAQHMNAMRGPNPSLEHPITGAPWAVGVMVPHGTGGQIWGDNQPYGSGEWGPRMGAIVSHASRLRGAMAAKHKLCTEQHGSASSTTPSASTQANRASSGRISNCGSTVTSSSSTSVSLSPRARDSR